jgi:hypothetical protein
VRRLEGGQRINSNTFAGTTVTSYGSEIHAEGGGSYDSLPYTAFQGGAGYLPIQLHEQVELNPGEFYGFLRVIVNDAGDELSILDGAYDDVRYRAINTPEPGALASLAASALTLAALRRRSSGSRVRGSR